jgi:putative sterol carrier protein
MSDETNENLSEQEASSSSQETNEDIISNQGSNEKEELNDEIEIETKPVVREPVKPIYSDPLEQIFLAVVPRSAEYNQRLRVNLPAPILFRIKDGTQVFTIDWTLEKINVTKEIHPNPACTISIKKDHLLSIAKGDLNPQVAMLSDKIEIEGQIGLAVYVFNLIAENNSYN